MRFILDLSPETQSMLERIYKQSRHHQVRQRAQCILMSFRGFKISELIIIFGVSRKTIYNWFTLWESEKLLGLYNQSGRGRKPLLDRGQKAQLKEWVKAEPRNLKKILIEIESE